MKKLFEELNRIMIGGNYDDYRIIVTPRIIELKLIPKLDKETESNWIKDNTKEDIKDLLWILETHY